MYNDEVMPGERIGETMNADKQGMYAERWDGAMDDAPEFAGEWGYGEQVDSGSVDGVEAEGTMEMPVGVEDGVEFGGANKMTSYGFDTASRIFGLEAVLKAVEDTDETGRDVENPLGAVYQRIAPTADERRYLYQEIRKDTANENRHDGEAGVSEKSRLGITANGEFYDRLAANSLAVSESTQAITALKRLLEVLETDERFADLRERAKADGKTIVEYLVSDQTNPTLSHFFNRTGEELAGMNVEQVSNEIEELIKEDEPVQEAESASGVDVPEVGD